MVIASRSSNGRVPEPGGSVTLAENARVVLERRYLAKDSQGEVIETPEQLFRRVAHNLAQAELNYGADPGRMTEIENQFYRVMTQLDFLPNSPTLGNAGRPLQQLSACFVLPVPDSIEGIFDTIKHTAMIHQSGGGCIAGDARVWTTFCGIEPIQVLVNRATLDGRAGVQCGAGTAFDVSDLGIQTLSMNPSTGETGLRPVTHVWRFDVPAECQVTVSTREGTIVQTSDWHPFMVVRGTELREVCAADLREGDVILGPDRPDVYWPWTEPRTVGSRVIDADLGWLIGFTLGDGSFGYVPSLRQYRVRWFSGTSDVLERVQSILARQGIAVSLQRDGRGVLSAATLTQCFVHDLLEACGLEKFGPKDDRIRVPEAIAKSPLPVVRAFLAGLIDSDGCVDKDGSPSYTTASEAMAQDLAALMSLLGYQPTVQEKAPNGKGRRTIYTVQLCPLPQVNDLARDLAPYLANGTRRERLQSSSRRQSALHLSFRAWRDRLAALGLVKPRGNTLGSSGPCAAELNRWSCNEGGRCRRDDLLAIAERVQSHDGALARLLSRIAIGGQEVERVERAATAKPYYDLSVDEWNTYAAGRSGLTMVHNTGFAFSRLRPEGSMVASTAGVASGPVSFMKVFDGATEAIKQGGTRRGANMGILVVDHPDIEKFIEVKSDMTTLTNFNISVAVTEKFMQAVERDDEYDLWDPHEEKVVGHRRAREIWDKLVYNAWKNGDPGLVFIDRINAANPVPQWGPIESTNPCGEQALGPYDSCNLGSINLANFAVRRASGWQVDWDRLGSVVPIAIRLLDNVIDMNRYPIPEIAHMSRQNRRVGLGVMGFADLLMKLGVPYNSEDAVRWAERIMQFIESRANAASLQLAEERGVFPAWEGSVYNTRPDLYPEKPRYRNCTRTTIAPTGTLSIIANCSSGIEPVFALAFLRQHYLDRKEAKKPTQLTEVNGYFLEIAQERGFYSEDLMGFLAQGGRLADRAEVPDDVKRLFVTAHDIEPEWHVRIQAAFQRHVDNGVSKTINFPHGATPADVETAYLLAYREGCKGITIYRDGSRDMQVLSHQGAQKADQSGEMTAAVVAQPAAAEPAAPRRRRLPDERLSLTHKFRVGDQEGYLTVGLYEDGSPGEVFIKVSKQGSTVSGLMDTIALLTSLALQHGVPLETLTSKLKGTRFEPSGMTDHPEIRTATSLVDYVARYLDYKYVDGGDTPHQQLPLWKGNVELLDVVPSQMAQTGMGCPECGSLLHYAEGCLICRGCGYSKCG